jgi:hypothetical protein
VTAVEQRYRRLEAEAEAVRARKQRRQPLILIALVNALIIATALTVMVDLRRLHTPGGTALAWVQAAVFGDCEKYRRYSVSDPLSALPDSRTTNERCRDLRAATATARADSIRVKLTLGRIQRRGDRAQVAVELTQSGTATPLSLNLVRSDGRWRVVRDASVCSHLVCA